jgi:hypothetical protein
LYSVRYYCHCIVVAIAIAIAIAIVVVSMQYVDALGFLVDQYVDALGVLAEFRKNKVKKFDHKTTTTVCTVSRNNHMST